MPDSCLEVDDDAVRYTLDLNTIRVDSMYMTSSCWDSHHNIFRQNRRSKWDTTMIKSIKPEVISQIPGVCHVETVMIWFLSRVNCHMFFTIRTNWVVSREPIPWRRFSTFLPRNSFYFRILAKVSKRGHGPCTLSYSHWVARSWGWITFVE